MVWHIGSTTRTCTPAHPSCGGGADGNHVSDVDKRLGGALSACSRARVTSLSSAFGRAASIAGNSTRSSWRVCCSSRSPSSHICERRRPAGFELGCPPPEINMLDENPHCRRFVGRPMASVGGHQQLLLKTESAGGPPSARTQQRPAPRARDESRSESTPPGCACRASRARSPGGDPPSSC